MLGAAVPVRLELQNLSLCRQEQDVPVVDWAYGAPPLDTHEQRRQPHGTIGVSVLFVFAECVTFGNDRHF